MWWMLQLLHVVNSTVWERTTMLSCFLWSYPGRYHMSSSKHCALYDKPSECPEEIGRDNDVSRAGLLNLGTLAIWGQIILCCGGCPVSCRILSSIPDPSPYLPVVFPSHCNNQNCLWMMPNQWSPTFLDQGPVSWKTIFSMDWVWEQRGWFSSNASDGEWRGTAGETSFSGPLLNFCSEARS